MPDARKKPCCICRRWFRPDPRTGSRQRACRNAECQSARRKKKQKQWRERYPEYFTTRRILDRGKVGRIPETLWLPPTMRQLPADSEKTEYGGKCIEFI